MYLAGVRRAGRADRGRVRQRDRAGPQRAGVASVRQRTRASRSAAQCGHPQLGAVQRVQSHRSRSAGVVLGAFGASWAFLVERPLLYRRARGAGRRASAPLGRRRHTPTGIRSSHSFDRT